MKNSIKRFGKNYLQRPKFYVKITHGYEISRCVGMADEADSKSVVGNHVRVQVPPPACIFRKEPRSYEASRFFLFFNILSGKKSST